MTVAINARQPDSRGSMEYLGPACHAEVVLAFLRAEIDSPRFQGPLSHALQRMSSNRETLIDHADLARSEQNCARERLLASTREPLFRRFPTDVAWSRCNVPLGELEQFQYANYRRLFELSGGRRNVRAGARRVLSEPGLLGRDLRGMLDSIPEVVDGVSSGRTFPELIAVRDSSMPRLVLVKGSLRATAYVIAGQPASADIYLGTSDHMHQWWLF